MVISEQTVSGMPQASKKDFERRKRVFQRTEGKFATKGYIVLCGHKYLRRRKKKLAGDGLVQLIKSCQKVVKSSTCNVPNTVCKEILRH